MLNGMLRYSFILGDWGKYLWVVIRLRPDGYNVESFVIDPPEIRRFESQNICNECLKYIYFSSYNSKTNSYNILFNYDVKELRKNTREVKNIIGKIETLAIDTYNIVVNSYLDSSNEYNKISIYFRRDIKDYDKIVEEIKESIIFGHSIPNNHEFIAQHYNKIIKENKESTIFRQSISKKYKSTDRPVYMFTALKEKKKDTNDGNEIELSYPDGYRFSFIVYKNK